MVAVRFRENQSEEQTIKILRNLNNHKKNVTSLCSTKNGKYLFSSSDDWTIKMWDVTNF